MDKLVVILVAFVWGGVEIYSQMQQRRRRGGAPTAADRGSLIVLYACITVGYSVAFAVSYVPYGRLPVGQPFWLVVGAGFIAGGLWIRRSAMATLAAYFTYQVEIQADHRLVEEGLYQRIRHPGYLGQLLVFLGLAWLSRTGCRSWDCSCRSRLASSGGSAWKRRPCGRGLRSDSMATAGGPGA